VRIDKVETKMVTRRTFTLSVAAAALSAAVPSLSVEAAPSPAPEVQFNRPVTIIVPFAKMGTTDQIARLIAAPLSKALGVAVNVENITGDWGTTGAVIAAHALADGHTLVMGQSATHVSPGRKMMAPRYDAVKDFTPIGLVGSAPMTIVARNDLPASDLESLRAYIKVYPRPMAIAHGGYGTPSHIGARKMKSVFGTPLLSEKVYASTMAAMEDLAEGRADMMATSLPQALPFIKAGKVKALGLAGSTESIALPAVYTGVQQGFEDLKATHWNGLFAPKNLAVEVRDRLARGLAIALNDHVTLRKMLELGIHAPAADQQGPGALAFLQAREIADLELALV
jgi:tripartite-type tricarboxylate transporter receptor subunit TctC